MLQPAGWRKPRGYSNGVKARGALVLTGGLVGWDENEVFAEGFVAQVERTLTNILAIVAEAGGGPEHVARLTWYVRSIDTYRASLADLAPVYRRVMGRHYPAMALVQVAGLVEPEALVEIEATAVVPE
ncbi:RidA family protein [Methylobacterium oryzihabitans]|uniref:RidA family protein n=1 Tax=Methylobacterium oryzihabitans TaxID=2499852 RepID=A0A3S2VSJ6_9HYPH|nr:RidA family protein [Methylobacterium oryzihabitans]RVU16222.1 RidA family protein [Methylobacterium oryzihabitans]